MAPAIEVGEIDLSLFIMNKEGKESICSCSSSNTRPATSTNSDQSVSCSSNRKHIKRRRIHMSKPKVSYRQPVAEAGLCLADNSDGRLLRMSKLKELWHCNRDAIINLLESICDGEKCMGDVNTERFWRNVTTTLVWELKRKLEINDETIESCKIYTQSLEKLHKEFQAKDKSLEKIRRKQVSLGSSDLMKKLFRIFGRKKISFNNSSINMPSIDPDLRDKVNATIRKLANAKMDRQCTCGKGPIVRRIATSSKNRDKAYYACPNSKPMEKNYGCGFFRWENELKCPYVQVVALSSYEESEEQFKEQVASLRQKFFQSIAPGGLAGDRRGVVPASSFSSSAQQIWKVIKENKPKRLIYQPIKLNSNLQKLTGMKLSKNKVDLMKDSVFGIL